MKRIFRSTFAKYYGKRCQAGSCATYVDLTSTTVPDTRIYGVIRRTRNPSNLLITITGTAAAVLRSLMSLANFHKYGAVFAQIYEINSDSSDDAAAV